MGLMLYIGLGLGFLALASYFLLPLMYAQAAAAARKRFPTLRDKCICLLIAHPDDEAMFFAPSVLALTRPELNNHVKILCLSSGDADGLGETRKRELVKSAMLLGLDDEDDVTVLESPDFPDSMTADWDAAKIAGMLCRAYTPNLAAQKKNAAHKPAPAAAIDAIVTFDDEGVSSHPNHVSLYYGARAFLRLLVRDRPDWTCPVDLYTLNSVGIARKYSSFLDAFTTLLLALKSGSSSFRGKSSGEGDEDEDGEDSPPGMLLSRSALSGRGVIAAADGEDEDDEDDDEAHERRACYGTARRAMVEAHKSQMVWFRWGWITLSRYMVVNDLKLERIKKRS